MYFPNHGDMMRLPSSAPAPPAHSLLPTVRLQPAHYFPQTLAPVPYSYGPDRPFHNSGGSLPAGSYYSPPPQSYLTPQTQYSTSYYSPLPPHGGYY